jgi:hypothetical protein
MARPDLAEEDTPGQSKIFDFPLPSSDLVTTNHRSDHLLTSIPARNLLSMIGDPIGKVLNVALKVRHQTFGFRVKLKTGREMMIL